MDRPEERVALIEVAERDGRPARGLDVAAWPLSIGRALDNTLVLDDPHVAAHHLQLLRDDDGALRLQVGDTVNGVQLDGRWLGAGASAALPTAGAQLQVGQTRLRLRLPGEALAAERVLPTRRVRVAALAGPGLALAALLAAVHALRLDPGAGLLPWLPLLLGAPVALLAWAALWALASKIFLHRFDLVGHLGVALGGALAVAATDALGPQAAAMLDSPVLWHLSGLAAAVLLVGWLRGHLLLLMPQRRRAIGATMALLLLAWGGTELAQNQRQHDRVFAAPYMSTLPLPWMRLARPSAAPAALADDLAPLQAQLQARVRQAAQDAAEGDDDE